MFDKNKYINNYNKTNYKDIKVRIRKDDNIVLSKINETKNINKYIRNLIYQDALKNRKYNFINNDVIIDFEVSKGMQYLIDEAEKADLNNDYGTYINFADAIDSKAKYETTHHIITESQWNKLVRRYTL